MFSPIALRSNMDFALETEKTPLCSRMPPAKLKKISKRELGYHIGAGLIEGNLDVRGPRGILLKEDAPAVGRYLHHALATRFSHPILSLRFRPIYREVLA